MSDSRKLPPTGGAFRRAGIKHTPGLAKDLLREMAPLLAEEGIDLDDPSTFDVSTINATLERIAERKNAETFTAVGPARDEAVHLLRLTSRYFAEEDLEGVELFLDGVDPDPADRDEASVAQVIGVALKLLDSWSSEPRAAALFSEARAPEWRNRARHAAADIFEFAQTGRAFSSLRTLVVKNGGIALLEGSVLAVGGMVIAWAVDDGVDVVTMAERVIV